MRPWDTMIMSCRDYETMRTMWLPHKDSEILRHIVVRLCDCGHVTMYHRDHEYETMRTMYTQTMRYWDHETMRPYDHETLRLDDTETMDPCVSERARKRGRWSENTMLTSFLSSYTQYPSNIHPLSIQCPSNAHAILILSPITDGDQGWLPWDSHYPVIHISRDNY